MSSVSDRYEVEQERLKQKHLPDSEDLHIEAPKEPQVNPEVYRDVEPLLFRGFITVSGEINEVTFVFKSLNHHEFGLLQLMGGSGSSQKAIQSYYNLFLAYSVVMVEGCNVLVDRNRWLPELTGTFDKLSDQARKKVVRYLGEVNRRANKAVIMTEAYSMEIQSRLRWAQLRGIDNTATAVTGFEGTSKLGMNWAQMTWRALNYFEDLKDQSEREWENAKFVASSMAGKAMSKIYSQDRSRRQREADERRARKDKVLRFALLDEPMDGPSQGIVKKVARTVEELADQLEKDLKGEKDWHDSVVESYEREIQSRYQQRVARVQEFQDTIVQEQGDAQLVGKTLIDGLSQEDVRRRILERQRLAASRLAVQQEYPEVFDPKKAEFIEKWASVSKGGEAPIKAVPFKRGDV